MPSGYTDPLYQGEDLTFEQFVLRCSRAMGAAIMQRDQSIDVEIELREVSDYHSERAEEARRKLAEAKMRPGEQWVAMEAEDRAQQLQAMQESIERLSAIRARYEAMLAQVRGWTPPTFEHNGLQQFMVEQLEESIKFDCDLGPVKVPALRSPEAYRDQVIERLQRDVDYHDHEYSKEQKRVAEQNAWVIALRDSLGLPALTA
jgi:hypothetical protein